MVVWYIDTFSAPLSASTPTQPPGGRLPTLCYRLPTLCYRLPTLCYRLPTLHLPTRFGVPFKLIWFYYTHRRAGCPRSGHSSLRGKLIQRYNKTPPIQYQHNHTHGRLFLP
ncbi:MAG: hypothetical protein LBQ66_10000 [Planctomycetaceae bacterium]|nr:hypothetical protein [Planctomycetaceae bacterium]